MNMWAKRQADTYIFAGSACQHRLDGDVDLFVHSLYDYDDSDYDYSSFCYPTW